jgi:hypothetical protein
MLPHERQRLGQDRGPFQPNLLIVLKIVHALPLCLMRF